MTVTDREITPDELQMIYDDFRKIEVSDGIPQRKTERYQFIIEDKDAVIGFVSGITEHKWFYLTDLWVDEKYRRQGLGSRLLAMIEQKGRDAGMEHIYLWTAGANNAAFYKKNSYAVFTVFENKYEVEGYHQIGFVKHLS